MRTATWSRPGPDGPWRLRRAVPAAVLLAAFVATACTGGSEGGDPGDGPSTEPVRVTVASGPADYVTGGDAVVAVDSPAGRSLADATVTVDGVDVSDRFSLDRAPHRPAAAPERLLGVVTGLPEGTTTVTARLGDDQASVELTNHPVAGPLFSGPHQSPLVCTTEAAGLGPPGDDCGAPGSIGWRYVDRQGALHVLADPGRVPGDVAATTTSLGQQVPFVVRVERQVLDRAVVETAILDPRPGTSSGATPEWDGSGWNGRLVLRFGGGCGVTYSQGEVLPTALQLDLLGQGYGVVASSFTSFETACNATLSAETAMVAKEHFAETYGVPRHTIGSGGSGGAIQQLQIAQNYPGVLDALAPSAAFPDAVSIAPGVADCGLLERWFGRDGGPAGVIPDGEASGASLSGQQQEAITGFATPVTCAVWTRTFLRTLDASEGCDAALVTQVYDLAVRPRGVRCTWQDGNVNVLGTDPATGYALRPLDNLGVQYGLEALLDGTIDVDEFLDLNEHVGGYDLDGTWQPGRTVASPDALERAYAAGMVTAGTATADAGALGPEGSGGLAEVPIVIVNLYTDPFGDIHDRQRAFAVRERLRAPDGTDDPLLSIWTAPIGDDVDTVARQFQGGPEDAGQPAVRVLDQWLTAAEDAGAESGSWAERLAAARPESAADRCQLPTGEVVSGPGTYADGSPCTQAYPVHGDPRQAAGAPLVNDVLACHLVDVDVEAYGVAFTAEQVQRLRAVFPDGVCDWSRPGRGQQAPSGTWQSYGG